MATRKDRTLRPQLSSLFNLGAIRERTDGQLLERFATDRGEVAELAFAALVERHGAMVMRVCRAQLSNPHDAQDAFQATFLVLVRKARALWVEDSLGPWLHQVALRTAACARAEAARRRKHEHQAAVLAATAEAREDGTDLELGARLHEAIDRLPERYRVPIILCDLEGHTCEEAARRMGRPVGTVKSWRSRGREKLRQRLVRVGLTPTGALAADLARATVPKPEAATVRAAAQFQANRTSAGEVPASVVMLVKGVMKAMLLSKLRTAATIAMALALFGAGIGTVARVVADDSKGMFDEPTNPAKTRVSLVKPREPRSLTREPGDTLWQLTLPDAVRIGLENSETIRVLKPQGKSAADEGYEVVRQDPSQDFRRCKAELMAHVRSIEQQYWVLVQQHAQLWGSEKAVELAEELKDREASELKDGIETTADLDEATQRLEQFRLDLVTKTSDVITAERQLRNVLGLPKADGRRIIPVSPPKEGKVSPDWNTCVANMLRKQPDIALAILKLEDSRRVRAVADLKRELDWLSPARHDPGTRAPSPERPSPDMNTFLKNYPSLQEVIHQTTHSLGRFFLEVDANYKQFKTASRLRAAAAQRLEAQRAFYEEGRITIDRYLDAVGQYASAVAQEAQFKTSYNISIVALEEAQGTVLESKRITVAQGSKGSGTIPGKHDRAAKPAAHESRGPIPDPDPRPQPHPSKEAESRTKDDPSNASETKAFSFEMTLPIGAKPVTIRGSFSVTPAPSTETSKAP